MIQFTLKLSLAVTLLFGSTFSQSQPNTIRFNIGDTKLVFSIPKGFCLPKGSMKELIGQFASTIAENVVHFTIVDSEQIHQFEERGIRISHYSMLQTPKGAVNKNWGKDRKSFIKNIVETAQRKDVEQRRHLSWQQRAVELETQLRNIRFGANTDLGWLDIDEFAAYAGMITPVIIHGDTVLVAGVHAITIVKEKLVFYYDCDDFKDKETISDLLDEVKMHMRSFLTKN